MKKTKVVKTFNRLIKGGAHALIIQDSRCTTLQPLTRQGHDAICSAFSDAGAGDDMLQALSRKRHGHYLTAVAVQGSPEAIASALVTDYGLPDGSVALSRVGFEIAPIGIDQHVH